jgi:hypothetical protein
MLIVIIDLTSKVTPSRAVSALEGERFKRTEHRMKRYSRGGAVAEAVHGGALRVMSIGPVAAIDNAILADRRWMTMMDFPWSTHMDSESMVLQHTTFVTHRVSVVCETGTDSNVESVRVEWEFAAGKDEDDCERVDWILEQLDAKGPVPASLTLKRLLREAEHKGRDDGIEEDGQGQVTEVRRQDEDVPEDGLPCDGEGAP